MTNTDAKGQGQRSHGSKLEWEQTDGRTDATALPPVLMRSVNIILPAPSFKKMYYIRLFILTQFYIVEQSSTVLPMILIFFKF